MEHAKWLEERRKGIGGSDVAAILGLSPWKTPFQVYQEKRNECKPFEGNDLTEWGKRMEPTIRQWYSDVTGRVVRLPDGIIYHAKHPFMLASLDGFTDDRRVVEIKTARNGSKWGEPGTDEIPDYYAVQVQHYLAVTGFEVADVPVSIGGALPVLYEIPADKEIHEMLVEAEAEFWQRVQEGNPPEPVTYSDAVQRFGKCDAAGEIQADEEIAKAYSELKFTQKQIKELETTEEDLKGKIIAFLGDKGDTLTNAGLALVTYKLASGRKSFDSKTFEKSYPELYQQFVKIGEPSRRFLIK